MSILLVGPDVLPNVYINNIEVSDFSATHHSAEVHVSILDMFDDTLNLYWSNKDMLAKNMQLMFVVSEDPFMTSELIKSNVLFNEFDIKRSEYYDLNTVQIQTKNVMPAKSFLRRGAIHFKHKFKFIFSKKSTRVTIFCSTMIDTRKLSHNHGLDLFSSNIHNHSGPVSSEDIMTNSKLQSRTTVFLRPSGVQYPGPVHYHPEQGYMEGSRHVASQHGKLTTKQVFNYKIKDYRSIKHTYKKKMSYTCNDGN